MPNAGYLQKALFLRTCPFPDQWVSDILPALRLESVRERPVPDPAPRQVPPCASAAATPLSEAGPSTWRPSAGWCGNRSCDPFEFVSAEVTAGPCPSDVGTAVELRGLLFWV